jgi:hypothetical protein
MQTTVTSPESDVRLPRAIRAQSERIRQLQETPPADGEQNPPADPPAIKQSSDPAPEPAPQQAAPEPPAQPLEDPRHSDPNYWRQRFNVTEGVLRRERQERTTEEQRLHQRISELQLELQRAQASQPAQAGAVELSQFFTPEQIEQYGEDQLGTVARTAVQAAKAEAQKAIQEAVQPLREQEEARQKAAEREAHQRFIDGLAEAVPDWGQIDPTPEWHAWLAQIDESTGEERDVLLKRHAGRRDVRRVAAMFDAYKAAIPRPPQPPVAPSGAARGQEAPIRQQPAAGGAPSPADIREFYKRASLGKLKPGEREEFEARLAMAARNAA